MHRALADPVIAVAPSTHATPQESTVVYNDDTNCGFYAFANARSTPITYPDISSTIGDEIRIVNGQKIYPGATNTKPQWHLAWVRKGRGERVRRAYTVPYQRVAHPTIQLYTGTDAKGREFLDGVEDFQVRVFSACFRSFPMPQHGISHGLWTRSFEFSARYLHDRIALQMDYYIMAPSFYRRSRPSDELSPDQEQALVAAIAADFVCENWYTIPHHRECESFKTHCFVFFAMLREAGHRFCVVNQTLMNHFAQHVLDWGTGKLNRPRFFETLQSDGRVPALQFKHTHYPSRPKRNRDGRETQCVCFWDNKEYLIANELRATYTDNECAYCNLGDDASV